MNKGIKAVLAIAIAILFPVVVGLIAYLAYPNQDNFNRNYPAYPDYNVCGSSSQSTSSRNSNSSSSYQACRDKLKDEYDIKVSEYNNSNDIFYEQSDKTLEKRLIVALIAALVGFILAFVSFKYTPIATGMSAASMILVLVTSAFYSGIIESSGATIVTLYLACFVVLIVMFVFADKYFPAPISEGSSKVETPMDKTPAKADQTTTTK
jgi:hypothetical protein